MIPRTTRYNIKIKASLQSSPKNYSMSLHSIMYLRNFETKGIEAFAIFREIMSKLKVKCAY